MNTLQILPRHMTPAELDRMRNGFDENAIDNGVEIQTSDRFSCTAIADGKFIGCSSGLAYKNGERYSGWFYLTDLFVEREFRGQGLGQRLLTDLEAQIIAAGLKNIWTWTAGYEAPGFYQKMGYEIFEAMELWYSDGSSRVGLKKQLTQKD